MDTYLYLENGCVFKGKGFGYNGEAEGEVVFQTGMVGYTESLTDPSYENQILVLTYPLIGNYGIPNDSRDSLGLLENFESDRIHVKALVVSDYEEKPNHWLSVKGIDSWLTENKVTGIYGVDTRAITKMVTESGTMRGKILYKEPSSVSWSSDIQQPNLVDLVSTKEVKIYNPDGKIKVLAIDCGIKNNQIRMLTQRGACVKLVPWDYDFIKDFESGEFNRLFISNGPGDPEDCSILIDRLKQFLEKACSTPVMGICLGHQILSLAAGSSTEKMKFGNRGHNIPCKQVGTNRCFITTQNHGYMVKGIPDSWDELFVNLNDNSNEGIIHKVNPWFSVQFHPEAKAGPEDTSYLFDTFLEGTIDKLRVLSKPFKRPIFKKVLILGSGGLSIGQSGEFDYSGSQAIKAYNEEGLTTVLINPNIATIQTSPGFADKVYFLPVTYKYVVKVIEQERPDCLALSFGGQTALNCGIDLYKSGILDKYGITILGTPVPTIITTEDREAFKHLLLEVGETVPEGFTSSNYKDALEKSKKLGYPLLVRAAYALGGLGSGFANNDKELETLLHGAFANSDQVIVDRSLRGWKEVEYEIVRDRFDNCISVCNMENVDPLGVHTGESIVVAPSQTLSDTEYNMLRTVSLKIIRRLGVVGECNIQFALSPDSLNYHIIEVNARLSRSSALASKATGYPLAYIAAKLSLEYSLAELKNSITKTTTACFEPSLDYCVVKVPRWDLQKFTMVNKNLDSAMKSIGESMGISRSFEEAFQKALRMSNESTDGFTPGVVPYNEDALSNCQYNRMFSIADGLYKGVSVDKIHQLTFIDKWFLRKMENIIKTMKILEDSDLNPTLLREAKRLGYTDRMIAKCTKSTETTVQTFRHNHGIFPTVKQIDTVAGEFPCYTNYLYLTYSGSQHDNIDFENNSIMVLGSGVYRIGSSVEFDWCGVNCVRELKNLGEKSVVLNCNPETVSTDYDEADKLYFDEISFETVVDVYCIEKPKGVILAMGGQLPNNIAMALHRNGVKIYGTEPTQIDNAENRYKFSRLLDSIRVNQPKWKELTSIEEAKKFCRQVKYPCLVRPSYVLSGAAMNVAYSDKDLEQYLGNAVSVSREYPVVISKFINDAKEIEVDAVADNGRLKLLAVSEHVENAGVHSGDATLILPARDITNQTMKKIKKSVAKIAKALDINGPFNIQFIAKDDRVLVIECNLRVSRTFPFVSKTLGVNFVNFATRCILGLNPDVPQTNNKAIGVKVAQFSFSRLKGADVKLGVEMLSTGEVACFGKTHRDAFLKAIVASCVKLPKKGVVVSVGSYRFKSELKQSIKLLKEMGYRVICTSGTADYYRENGLDVEELPLFVDDDTPSVVNTIDRGEVDLVINISQTNKIRCVNDPKTGGYILRRCAVDNGVSIMTDIKKTKLFVESLYLNNVTNKGEARVDTAVDCVTSFKTVRIPGLYDVHVHVREPGDSYKEDWSSLTKAAIAGGITGVCVMPNVNPPVVDRESFDNVKRIAQSKAHCDYAIFVGANSHNSEVAHKLVDSVAGIKMYLNNTFGPLLLKDVSDWVDHVKAWPDSEKPMVVHAEAKILPAILHVANIMKKRIHVAHVSSKDEIEIIRASKEAGMRITCEVAPHHLFFDKETFLDKKLIEVKPPLGMSTDRQALWDNMDIIDCFATDHAPHTVDDKHCKFCPGFPGLETALPLLLTAVDDGRLTLQDVIDRYYENPRKIFGLPEQENTYVEIDMNRRWEVPDKMKYSKCGWTPFKGFKVCGKVVRVVLRGKVVYVDGEVINKPGTGLDMRQIVVPTEVPKLSCDDNLYNSVEIENDVTSTTKPITIKHIVSVDQLSKDFCRLIFKRADEMRKLVKTEGCTDLLKDKVLASIFYEPSSRTRCSFSAAMVRLGGKVVGIGAEESSVKKGETLEDFIRCMESYTDMTLIRNKQVGLEDVLKHAKNPVINCGDGVGEHPTQALLDVYTIREERGTVNGLVVALIGDLKNGRTVHSLAKLLCLYTVRLRLIAPDGLEIPDDIKRYLTKNKVDWTEHRSLDEVVDKIDVLYVTRIQRERFTNSSVVYDSYRVTPKSLTNSKSNLVIMHPLPRVDEISLEIDKDSRAAYFRQMENGMYVRMAILATMFGR